MTENILGMLNGNNPALKAIAEALSSVGKSSSKKLFPDGQAVVDAEAEMAAAAAPVAKAVLDQEAKQTLLTAAVGGLALYGAASLLNKILR